MKSAMPFLGLAAPQRRRVAAAVVGDAALQPITGATTLSDTVLALWRGATHRD